MERTQYLSTISTAIKQFPVLAILGPRQCGKTTLARTLFENQQFSPDTQRRNYFDLEDPEALARLQQPKLALSELEGLVVIDEIQRLPEIFPLLRVLSDRKSPRTRFLILGSASRDLIRQSSESLAGRVHYVELTPFRLEEVGMESLSNLWLRGGFPRSFLADSDNESFLWRESYVRTFLERDVPQLGIAIPAQQLRRFWMMLTHNHGQILNISDLGRSFGTSETTIRRYLDVLAGTFMMRLLPPWHENIGKRQVKRPKLFFRDSGIFHTLLGCEGKSALELSPKLGPSWEGFALEEVIRSSGASAEETYFWSVHAQAELDLLIVRSGKKRGFEIKYSDAPTITKSMIAARDLLGLDELTVIYPGGEEYPLDDRIRVCGLRNFVAG